MYVSKSLVAWIYSDYEYVFDKFKPSFEVVNQHLCKKILNTVLPLQISATNLCSKITPIVTAFVYDLLKIDRCIMGSLQSSRMIGVNLNEESGQNINCVLITYVSYMRTKAWEVKLSGVVLPASFLLANFHKRFLSWRTHTAHMVQFLSSLLSCRVRFLKGTLEFFIDLILWDSL